MTRIGILGGSFDPPHLAHITMAQVARARLGLDQVLLMPATEPPHKPSAGLSDYSHRLAMTEIATEGVDGVTASRFEERHPGSSYTVELLRDFAAENPGAELYFILGSDSLAELAAWRQPEELLSRCTLVVFTRRGHPVRLDVNAPAALVVFEEPVIDVSSTELRERVRRGEAVDRLVSPRVLAYIEEQSLYR